MAGSGAGASRFAGAVMLGGLDDFIAPSQSCVNPLFVGEKKKPDAAEPPADPRGVARITLDLDDFARPAATEGTRPNLIRTTGEKTAKVSLNDCLACSGCVTSAETVLITQQSADELLAALRNPTIRRVVVSVAPQSLASLAAHFGLPSALDAYRRLATFLRGLGVHDVLDTVAASDFVLTELVAEFEDRLHRRRATPRPWVAPPVTVALSRTRDEVPSTDPSSTAAAVHPSPPPSAAEGASTAESKGDDDAGADLPLLVSACPGWICYAEKTHPEAIPYLSTVKSPQQVMGALVKHVLVQRLSRGVEGRRGMSAPEVGSGGGGGGGGGGGVPVAAEDDSSLPISDSAQGRTLLPGEIFHVCIMPCFDKKLEASRRDFEDDETHVRDVDCVLTTGEIVELLRTHGVASLDSVPETDLRGPRDDDDAADDDEEADDADDPLRILRSVSADGTFLRAPVVENAGSGGFLDFVLRRVARERFGVTMASPLPFVAGRNADFREVSLTVDGEPVLRFALAYGFRNIQTVVNKLKRGKSPYDFVEVMACPSGCLNGGGQATPEAPSTVTDAESRDDAEEPVRAFDARAASKARVEHVRALLEARTQRDPRVDRVYRDFLGGAPGSETARAWLHTRYHAVAPMASSLAMKW